jgi:hypothetical protein
MNWITALTTAAVLLGSALAPVLAVPQEPKGKTCRMEQQCHWENFKKVCTYVKECR